MLGRCMNIAGAVEQVIQKLFLPLCSFVRHFVILCV